MNTACIREIDLASSMALVSFLRSAFSFLTKASRSRISRSFASFSRCGKRSIGKGKSYACPGLVFINFGFLRWTANIVQRWSTDGQVTS